MNKYQEALDRMYDNYVYGAKQKEDSYFTLQELVDKVPYYEELEDKATPIKPIQVRKAFKNIDLSMFDCPSCNLGVMPSYYPPGLNDYCSHCGQRLDWSD